MRGAVALFGLGAVGIAAYVFLKQNAGSCGSETPCCSSPADEVSVGGTNIIATSDIITYALNAGFDESNVLNAVAVALAESGGNTNAYNPESAYFQRHGIDGTGMGSFGLWQIFKHAHPETAQLDLTDPQINATFAFKVYSQAGRSFKPWSTFGNGAYSARLDDAQNAYSVVAAASGAEPQLSSCGDCCCQAG